MAYSGDHRSRQRDRGHTLVCLGGQLPDRGTAGTDSSSGVEQPWGFYAYGGVLRQPGKGIPYKILEADYYAQAGARELAECLNKNYRYVIVDYGEITGQGFADCARCDLKVIVGSLSEWQAEAFLKIIREDEKRDRSWKYAAAFGSEETRESIEKSYRIPVWRIPCAKDAFAITHADIIFLKEL